jgi:hypothetical protein
MFRRAKPRPAPWLGGPVPAAVTEPRNAEAGPVGPASSLLSTAGMGASRLTRLTRLLLLSAAM